MEFAKKNLSSKLGSTTYINKNCWLAKTLGSSPSKRCQYCHLKFRKCLFFQYLIISLTLVSFLFTVSFLVEGKISKLVIICIFVLVIIYGYFFNQSTEKIIESNFAQRKAKEALEELTEKLEDKVEVQTHSLKTKNLHLQKLLKMRSEFLDVASHQLRTPVSVIKNTIEMMDDGDFDKITLVERKKYIHNAYEKSIKLQQIISDILVTSELDTVDFTVHNKNAQAVQLEDLVEGAISDVKFEADKRKIILGWSKPKVKLPPIAGYEQYLKQAVFNLIDNAIKYTPSIGETSETRDTRTESGRVEVSLEANDDMVVLTVKDNGIGIPEKELKNMFKKFSRASNARNMYTDGTGLGLFIVKEIVEGHHGRVEVQSKTNLGTTFRIYLPIKKDGN